MPKVGCGICNSDARSHIDNYLLNGISMREIARKFPFSEATIRRHRHKCFKEAVNGEKPRLDTIGIKDLSSSDTFIISNVSTKKTINDLEIAYKESKENSAPDSPIIGSTNSNYIPSSYIDIHDIDDSIPKGNDIGEWIEYIRNYLIKFIIKTEKKGKDHLTLLALKELRNNIELLIRASELFAQREAKTETKQLVEIISRALAPYKEASIAVSNELRIFNN